MSADPATSDILAARRFRASPQFEVVPLDQLRPAESALADALRSDSSWFGILRPSDSSRPSKSISGDVARLLADLHSPATLETLGESARDRELRRGVLRLLLDGVVEVETDAGFRGGSAAIGALRSWGWPAAPSVEPLSLAAVEYGARLRATDRIWLSGRLYGYNRWPLSARSLTKLAARSTEEILGLSNGLRIRVERNWHVSTSDGPWLRFARRGAAGAAPTHKLYVSASLDDAGDALGVAVDAFTRTGTPGFKVVATVEELARPDRLVAYFNDRDALLETAQVLDSQLRGLSGQGVPFTAPVGESGLLSWGMDPPLDRSRLPWQGPSWRRWVTDVIATALVDGGAAPTESVDLAISRVALEGVDPVSWTPDEEIWRMAA